MKKTLLALAIGSVIAAPSLSLANTDLYGKVNLSVDHFDGPIGAGDNGIYQLNSNHSFFGIRGNADLNGGLKGIYQLEFGVNLDRNPIAGGALNLLMSRNSFLGLEGGFGTIKAGHFDTPLRELSIAVNQFHEQVYADGTNMMVGEWRAENIIQYSTPKLADMLTLNVATVLAEDGDDPQDNGSNNRKMFDHVTVTAMFDLGQLYAGLGYDKNNYAGAGNNGFNIGSIYGVGPVYGFIGGVDLVGAPSVEIVRAVGGFKSDALEIGLLVQEAKYTQNSDFKDLTWQLSAGFGVGENLKLKAQYTNTDANNADTSADQATIGADYKLGAQTKIYAYATRGEADNDRVGAITGVGAEHRF